MEGDKEYLPMRQAKQFLQKSGVAFDVSGVKVAPELSKKALLVRKGYVFTALEDNGLLEGFVRECWPGAAHNRAAKKFEKYRRIKQQNEELLDGAGAEEEEWEDAQEIAFGLEYQLRDFLAHNLDAIGVGGKKLSLFVGADGRNGIEYATGVGNIDILAVDKAGNYYVLELKRAASPDNAIGQLARYMGWVADKLAQGKAVHGIIVAHEINDKLKYAAKVIPNVMLLEYQVTFSLTPAD
ncbi:MAG: endonuclease NucS [Gammaproteobacteria bacterium]